MSTKNIHIHNYEEFALDYVDGLLSKSQQSEFDQFLQAHPDIKTELENFNRLTIPVPNHITHPNKESLYKDERHFVLSPFLLSIAAGFTILVVAGYFIISQNSPQPKENDVFELSLTGKSITTELENNEEELIGHSNKALNADESNNPKETTDKSNINKAASKAINNQDFVIAPIPVTLKKENVIPVKDYKKEIIANDKADLKEQEIGGQIENKQLLAQSIKTEGAQNDNLVNIKSSELNELSINKGKDISLPPTRVILAHIQYLPTINELSEIQSSTYSSLKNENISSRLAYIQTREKLSKKRFIGKLAFANMSVSFVPSYLQKNKN